MLQALREEVLSKTSQTKQDTTTEYIELDDSGVESVNHSVDTEELEIDEMELEQTEIEEVDVEETNVDVIVEPVSDTGQEVTADEAVTSDQDSTESVDSNTKVKKGQQDGQEVNDTAGVTDTAAKDSDMDSRNMQPFRETLSEFEMLAKVGKDL